jgi:hypothetical protein
VRWVDFKAKRMTFINIKAKCLKFGMEPANLFKGAYIVGDAVKECVEREPLNTWELEQRLKKAGFNVRVRKTDDGKNCTFYQVEDR